MRRTAAFFIFGLAVAAALPVWPETGAEGSSTREPDAHDMAVINDYSQDVGREVLKDKLGLDLSALRFQFDPATMSIENLGKAPVRRASGDPGYTGIPGAGPEAAGASGRFSLEVDQRGDLMRLSRDTRDIPFGVEVRGDVPLLARLTALQTSVWVPFSWRDELKAEAKVPLQKMNLGVARTLMSTMGMSDRLDLRSDYTNRLGINQVEAGLGTQWASGFTGLMDLDYDYSQRFGQGLDETIHWLKLRKDF